MRIVQFRMRADPHKTPRVGFLRDDYTIIDFQTIDEHAPNTLIEILKKKPQLLKVDVQTFSSMEQDIIKIEDIWFLPPITGSDKVVCVGMNYRDHCEEQNVPVPEEPIFFNKFPSCLHGPFAQIPYPEVTTELDWEVELAIVIKKKGKNIAANEAYGHVLGYTVANDLSARDWQLKKNGGQWLIGKSMDAFCPLGPVIVTHFELGSAQELDISCKVNGVTKQDSNTSRMIFNVPDLVCQLSKFVTLRPGDVILTGTPPGVGVFAKPPCFLKAGDVVECTIDRIGTIRNRIAAPQSRHGVDEDFHQ